MKKLFFKWNALLFLSVFFVACQEDLTKTDTTIKYDVSLGLPIGTGNFGLANILNKMYEGQDLKEDETSHFYFLMKNEGSFSLRDIKLLPDGTTVSAGEKLLCTVVLPAGFPLPLPFDISNPAFASYKRSVIKSEKFIDFSLDTSGADERIDSAGIAHSELKIRLKKSGTVGLKIHSFKITFPMVNDATRDTIELNIPNPEFDQDYVRSIDDFIVKIHKNPLDPLSKGGFNFKIEVDAEFTTGQLAATDDIEYEVTYTVFKHKVVYGKFSPSPATAKTTTALNFNFLRDLNQGESEGVLLFDDIQVHLTIKNYDIGLKLNLAIDSVRGYRRDDPVATRVYKYAKFDNGTNYGLSKVFPTRPLKPFTGNPSILTLDLNKENGELDKFFEKDFLTDRFEFDFSIANAVDASGYPMFVTGDANITCDVDFRIPLKLRAGSYYIYTDTIKGFKEAFDSPLLQNLEFAELGIGLENGMPLDVQIHFALHNADGSLIPSDLGSQKFYVKAAKTNTGGEVVDKDLSKGDFKILLNQKTINAMRKAAYITYTAKAGNSDASTNNIFFKSDNRFNIKLNLFAKGGFQGDISDIKGGNK